MWSTTAFEVSANDKRAKVNEMNVPVNEAFARNQSIIGDAVTDASTFSSPGRVKNASHSQIAVELDRASGELCPPRCPHAEPLAMPLCTGWSVLDQPVCSLCKLYRCAQEHSFPMSTGDSIELAGATRFLESVFAAQTI